MSKNFYRSFAIVGIITHVLWGITVPIANPGLLVDSFEHRLLISIPISLLILISFFSKTIYKHIEWITYAAIIEVTFDYCYLIYINNNIFHSTGLYVVLAICLCVINNRQFLFLYSLSFLAFCIFQILNPNLTFLEKTHWGNMITLIILASPFALWRIKVVEDLDKAHKDNLEKTQRLEVLNDIATQAAHDIRSPVMALEAVSKSFSSNDDKLQKLVSSSTKRINAIADNLLNEYKRRFSTNNISHSLNSLIKEIVEEKRQTISSHQKISYSSQNEIFCPSTISAQDLKRVISNLLNNAIEACDKFNTKIKVETIQTNNNIEIKITDNGKGISEENLSKIFDKGVSIDKNQGTGLGLFHAREYIESVGGQIKIKSKLGSGTTLHLIFLFHKK
jgi:signal transduction histidine kinase